MKTPKVALILGGGVGGLVAANKLRNALPKEHRIVLIDRESDHLFSPSLLWLMIGNRKPEKIRKPLGLLKKKGIEILSGEINQISPDIKTVRVGDQKLSGDALIISLGAELAPDLIPGLSSVGYNLYTLQGATALRDALKQFESGRIVILTAVPAYKCPAAPYEAAMLIEYECRRRKIRDNVNIELYAAEPGPMGIAGPEISGAVRKMVEGKGILYHPSHQVLSVDPNTRTIRFTNDGHTNFDLLVYVPPHRAPSVVKEAGLLNENGWISVDRHRLETTYPFVFAIGDITSIPLKLGKPLPKAGVFAHGQAEVVAQNIAHAWTGKGKRRVFNGYGECFIETGDGKAGIGRGNFYAEPNPQMKMRNPSYLWHMGKVLFEMNWLRRWF